MDVLGRCVGSWGSGGVARYDHIPFHTCMKFSRINKKFEGSILDYGKTVGIIASIW